MECRKCKRDIPGDAIICCYCGQAVNPPAQRKKSRGNGQGSVYQLPNKRYIAVKILGYYLDDDGKKHKRTVSKCFEKKRDAVNALPLLGLEESPSGKAAKKARTTLKELYDLWYPTHRAGKSTLGNYSAAINYFESLYHLPVRDIDIDDLQECIDECPRGKSTRKNMRTVIGLVYKYGIPRGYLPEKLDLSEYLVISGESGAGGVSLPTEYLEAIRKAVGRVSGADLVFAHCYLGFRPSELLALDVESYDPLEKAFVGGAKTEAGKNRTVTVSPKIQSIIDRLIAGRTAGPLICTDTGARLGLKQYRALFYDLLDRLGLDNPTYDVNGHQKHTYTPHSCRHTFATLMKRVDGNSKDKLELIGHSSEEMLRYYQDVNLDDLRKITDAI